VAPAYIQLLPRLRNIRLGSKSSPGRNTPVHFFGIVKKKVFMTLTQVKLPTILIGGSLAEYSQAEKEKKNSNYSSFFRPL
jgi:hypothetical protein